MRAGEPAAAVIGSGQWWNEHRLRHTRRRPRADGLTIERIVGAALALVDREGLEALTVRRLADELGTGSASLYRHIASREELLVLLVDHVLGEIGFPPDTLRGRARVEHLAAELRRVLMTHRNLLPALTASPLLGPNALRGAEQGLASLLGAGFEPAAAVPAYLALIDYVLGTVYFDTSRAGAAAGGPGSAELFAALPSGGYPTLRAHEGAIECTSAPDVFRFGLTIFLDGLECRFPPG